MTTNDLIKTENEEREAIILNTEKKNVIISAGAGAGKTEMLSRSILTRLISDPELEPSQVVAITFTNAATEELKARLYEKYEELEEEAAKDGRSIRRINIDDIFVSTIHSFCSSLVTQMSFECGLGISPEFEENTDLSESRDVEVFIRNYIRKHREFDTLKEYYGYSTYSGIKDAFIKLAENPELELIIESDAEAPDDDAKKCLDPIKNNIRRITDMSAPDGLAKELRTAAADGLGNKYSLSTILTLIKKYYTPLAKEKSCRLYQIMKGAYDLLVENRIDKDTIKAREEDCIDLLGDTLDALNKLSRETISPGLGCFIKKDYGELLDAADKLEEVIGEKKGRLAKLRALAITKIRKPFEDPKKDMSMESYPYANSKSIISDYEPTEEDKSFFMELADVFDKLVYKDVSALSSVYEEYYKRLKAEYIKGMYEEYVKLERTTINSNDLLVLSKKLLYGNRLRAVREYFRSKYKVFYVDEFQDTDYLQLRMILALAGDDKGGLAEGRLFLVGDPKQSIYRFRGAEVAFYAYMKDKFFKDDEFHDLRLNYRSEKSVVDWINRTYSKEFEGGDIEYSDMIPVKNCQGTADTAAPSPELTELKENEGRLPPGVFEEKTEVLDAYIVAERAAGLLGKIITVFDNKAGKNIEKTVAPEDIMIITKTKRDATNIYDALKEMNIPVTVSGRILPAEKRAMRRLKALMRYIESGTRLRTAEAVAAFSPFSGLRPDGGFNGNGTITDSYTLEQAERLSDILACSEKLYYSGGAMAVIYNALNKGYLLDSYMNDMTLNDEMPMLCQLIETMSVECYDNIGAVNEYISEFIDKELKNVLSQSRDARCVRVMNVHQTKGLEANIVINVDYDFRDPSDRYLFEYYCKDEASGEFEVYEIPKCYLIASKEKQDKKRSLRKAEAIRKNYVSDTRAEYIMLFMRNNTDAPSDAAPAVKDDATENSNEAAAPTVFSLCPRENSLAAFDFCYMSANPSSLEKSKSRDDPGAVRTVPRITLGKENTEDPGNKAGEIRGTVMHRAFELYLLSRKLPEETTDERLGHYAKQAVIESMTEIEKTGASSDEITTLYESILNDVRVFREWFERSPYAACQTAMETPFCMVIDNSPLNDDHKELCSLIEQNRKDAMTKAPKSIPAEKIFFTGFSDLICIDGEGKFTVIDYKSDEAGYRESTMLEKYSPQQLAYYLAFGSILKQYAPKSREQLLYAPHAFQDRLTIKGEI